MINISVKTHFKDNYKEKHFQLYNGVVYKFIIKIK